MQTVQKERKRKTVVFKAQNRKTVSEKARNRKPLATVTPTVSLRSFPATIPSRYTFLFNQLSISGMTRKGIVIQFNEAFNGAKLGLRSSV